MQSNSTLSTTSKWFSWLRKRKFFECYLSFINIISVRIWKIWMYLLKMKTRWSLWYLWGKYLCTDTYPLGMYFIDWTKSEFLWFGITSRIHAIHARIYHYLKPSASKVSTMRMCQKIDSLYPTSGEIEAIETNNFTDAQIGNVFSVCSAWHSPFLRIIIVSLIGFLLYKRVLRVSHPIIIFWILILYALN